MTPLPIQPRTLFISLRYYIDRRGKRLNVLDDPRVDRLLESITGITHEWTSRRLRALTLATWALAVSIRLRKLLLRGLGVSRQKYDLTVRSLGHSLHGLEISDLHGWSRAQDVGGLPHQLGAFDLGACRDDFRLSDTLALGGHGEGVLELGAEDDILNEHRLDLDTPA